MRKIVKKNIKVNPQDVIEYNKHYNKLEQYYSKLINNCNNCHMNDGYTDDKNIGTRPCGQPMCWYQLDFDNDVKDLDLEFEGLI